MKALSFVLGFIVLVILAIALVRWLPEGKGPDVAVNSYEECVAAGNPVMESYPQQCRANGKTYTQDIGNELEMTDLIVIDSPRPNETVSSPLEIRGEARGTWYFEATFPIILEGVDGTQYAGSYATAQDEWMTEEFVPFAASISFPTAPKGKAYLILQKDNPSGLPENDAALRIPVYIE